MNTPSVEFTLNQPRPFTDKKLVSFAGYIDSKKREGECARFKDIQLMDLYKLAPFIYIFDIDHLGGKWLLRFFGTQLVQAYGRDLTGADVHEAIKRGPNAVELTAAMDKMIADKKPLWSINTVETDKETEFREKKLVAYERIAYPLLGCDDRVDHVISIVHVYPSPVDHPFQTRLFD